MANDWINYKGIARTFLSCSLEAGTQTKDHPHASMTYQISGQVSKPHNAKFSRLSEFGPLKYDVCTAHASIKGRILAQIQADSG